MRRQLLALATGFVFAIGGLSPTTASTITDNFTFTGNPGEFNYGPPANTVLATGSFSYDSSLALGALTYNDLSAFSITVLGVTYDKAFALGSTAGDYNYFGWNTALSSWVPANVAGNQGTFAGILAATQISGNLSSGFFFDPLVPQSILGNNDGVVEEYRQQAFGTVTSIQTSATPLPSTWLMLLSGFVGLGFFTYRGSKKHSAAFAAA